MANSQIDSAALAISAGELVAFPTETVYGLGADACNDLGVAKIFAAKGRPSDHPLIVHVASPSGVPHFASEIPVFAQKLIAAFWPGPLTVILPRRPSVARAAAGGQNSIGLRCPSHPMALSLLRASEKLGVHGLAAPSANRFGRVSPTSAAHVKSEFQAEFGDGLLVLDGGDCDVGIESAIVDCTRGAPVLLRHGILTLKQLENACGEPLLLPEALSSKAPKASGTLESHYAPRAKVRLISSDEMQQFPPNAKRAQYVLPKTPELAAHELFATLRRLDETGVAEICVSTPPPGEAWDGVRDRLMRAAA